MYLYCHIIYDPFYLTLAGDMNYPYLGQQMPFIAEWFAASTPEFPDRVTAPGEVVRDLPSPAGCVEVHEGNPAHRGPDRRLQER